MREGRTAVAAVSTAGLLLSVGACGSGEPQARSSGSPAAVPPQSSPVLSAPATEGTATSAPTASTPTAPTSTASTSTASTSTASTLVDPAETVFFQAPSGNITCSLAAAEAVCEIREHDFTPPRKPADCEFDHGTMVSVRTGGPASFLCHSDTAFVQATPDDPDSPVHGYGDVLPYGEQLSNGALMCSSSETAMSCATTDGEHGFELSRATYRVH